MKTTDFAMIFLAIIIPIVIVVYVDVALMLKKEEQTLYYKNIIDSAINDATYAMKNVEGEGQDVEYGYSGKTEKRVSVNARIAVEAFYESLYDNFEVNGDEVSEYYIKNHIPAVAIVDYNGVYIYSLDEYVGEDGKEHIDYILKPKRYYTYTYAITNSSEKLISGEKITETYGMDDDDLKYYTVIFTMDEYIGLIGQDSIISWFYLDDEKNNTQLYDGENSLLKEEIIQHLKLKRSQIISKIISQELSFAVSNHNLYSEIEYNFTFPDISISDWDDMVDNVGIIAFMQGINLGNVKLDYVAHGISGLKLTERYYVSVRTTGVSNLNYYHKTNECKIYLDSRKNFTGYYMNKTDAATNGYYPCYMCSP